MTPPDWQRPAAANDPEPELMRRVDALDPPAPTGPTDDEAVIDLQLQAMAFETALRYAERVLPRSLLDFLA